MKLQIGKYVPVFLGVLFAYSGGYKVIHPGEATYALVSLDLPHWLAIGTIIFTAAVELYLGLILLFEADLKFGLIAATVLLSAFTLFLWYLSTMAHPPACGCMGLTGMFNSGKKAAIAGLARNCLLLWGLKLAYDYYVKQTPNTPLSS